MKKILIILGFLLTNTALMAFNPGAEKSGEPVLVYPDKSGTIMNIEIKNTKEKVVFYMYNEAGKDLTDKIIYITNTAFKKQMDISHLKPGTYFIWYHANDAYRVNKLIIS